MILSMWLLFVGLGLGIAASIPIAQVWSRRTERRVRQLEARARGAERLAELGTMTGGLAHEIKNPLSTLGLNVQLLQEDLDELADSLTPTQDATDRIGRIRRRGDSLHREAKRLREILEDFLRYAGRMQLDGSQVDINQLVGELVDFFEPQATEAGSHLRTQLAAGPLEAWVDAGLLKQALLNLLINATQAMSAAQQQCQASGGADELMIRTDRGREAGEPVVRIMVTDTGPGIDPKALQHIFEPYFSTKRSGTGLGLPTSRRIVEEHGGSLSVHSEPSRGTEFVITLPVEKKEG